VAAFKASWRQLT